MATSSEYYNEQYAAISSDYRAAEERDRLRPAELNDEASEKKSSEEDEEEKEGTRRASELNDASPESNRPAPKSNRQRRRSRYDEDAYALPDVSDADSTSLEHQCPTHDPQTNLKWKCVSFFSTLVAILAVAGLVVHILLVPAEIEANGSLKDFQIIT